jgi:hypothetical protein
MARFFYVHEKRPLLLHPTSQLLGPSGSVE